MLVLWLFAAVVACEPAAPAVAQRPAVARAVPVPLRAFAAWERSAVADAVACTGLDPAGASVRALPLVVNVSAADIGVRGQPVVALEAGEVPAGGRAGRIVKDLFDALLVVRDAHEDAREGYACRDAEPLRVLVDVDPAAAASTLWLVVYTAAQADIGEAWVRVDADAPALPTGATRPPLAEGDERCVQQWGVRVGADTLTAGRLGESATTLADGAALAEALSTPDWAELMVAVAFEEAVSAQRVADLVSEVGPAVWPRGAVVLGEPPTGVASWAAPTGSGPVVSALPLSFGALAGECLFASAAGTCVGLDGARHPWRADPCRGARRDRGVGDVDKQAWVGAGGAPRARRPEGRGGGAVPVAGAGGDRDGARRRDPRRGPTARPEAGGTRPEPLQKGPLRLDAVVRPSRRDDEHPRGLCRLVDDDVGAGVARREAQGVAGLQHGPLVAADGDDLPLQHDDELLGRGVAVGRGHGPPGRHDVVVHEQVPQAPRCRLDGGQAVGRAGAAGSQLGVVGVLQADPAAHRRTSTRLDHSGTYTDSESPLAVNVSPVSTSSNVAPGVRPA